MLTTYGDKRCYVCRLTVAPYINGNAERCAYGPRAYVHFRCRNPATPDLRPLFPHSKQKKEVHANDV